MKLELFWPVEKPRNDSYNRFGDNVELYKKFNIGLNNGHNGIDITMQDQTGAYNIKSFPVYAAHDGIVTYAGSDKNEGMGVVIRTKEPREYLGGIAYIKSIYWHNAYPDGVKVRVGQEVKVGDLLAMSDTTGLATGPHLHWGLKPIAPGENEWTWNNVEQNNGYMGAIDPIPYVQQLTAKEYKDARGALEKARDLLERIKRAIELLKGR